ncbi:MAG: SpoIIIAH-like family protein [Clostridia bacterium]|nr:SpoIIIAH-like family protein [Clostridia bacterium]
MVFRKKQLTLIMLALLICFAGYLNFMSENSFISNEASESYMGEAKLVGNMGEDSYETDFFSRARLERESGRSKSIETFNEIINNENTDVTSKETAQRGILEMADNTETETAIENLIKARGFADAVCYINNSQANVVVKAESLDEMQVSIITEIVTEQTSIPPEKIKVVEIK